MTAVVFSLATQAASDRPNEDFVLTTAEVAIVVDGEGAPGDDCVHGVAWYVRQLGAHTLAALVDDPRLPLAEGLARGIRTVSRMHVYTCDLSSTRTPSATMGILRVGTDTIDTLTLGDCTVVVDTKAGPQVTRSGGGDVHRVFADPSATRHALMNSYPRTWARRAAVLTDGAAAPAGAVGWSEYLDLLDKLGPAGTIRHLRLTARPWGVDPAAGGAHEVDDATVVHAVLD